MCTLLIKTIACVICKGKVETKKGRDTLYYCKIKTDDWFERLRAKGDQKLLS